MLRSMLSAFLLNVLIVPPLASPAASQDTKLCGDAPIMQDGTVKGHIDGQATFLKRFLGDAKLQTEIEIAKNDVLQRYPRADALRINQYFLYVTCVYLMLDTKLTTPEKLRELRIMRETLSPAAVPVSLRSRRLRPNVQQDNGQQFHHLRHRLQRTKNVMHMRQLSSR